jgi:uncharacterized surface protein with fasciclin (FAS1) repeats
MFSCQENQLSHYESVTINQANSLYMKDPQPLAVQPSETPTNIEEAFMSMLKRFAIAAATAAALAAHTLPGLAQDKDIVDTAMGAGQFNTLAAALQAAGLVETLKGAGPFTVFAPTDEAFAKLPAGTVDDLLKPENKDKLTAVLTYHVVAGKVMAADVVTMSEAATVNGAKLAIKVDGGTVMINGAKVTAADVGASNGVIHVIDSVVLPPAN